MNNLWQMVEVPTRPIYINNKILKKFPFFEQLFYEKVGEIFTYQKIDKILMKNASEVGISEESLMVFYFFVMNTTKINELRYQFTIVFKEDLKCKNYEMLYKKNSIKTKLNVFEIENNNLRDELKSFFAKLEDKTKNLYVPIKQKLTQIITSSELNKLMNEPLFKYYVSMSSKFNINIEYIDQNDFRKDGILRYYPCENLNDIKRDLSWLIENNTKLRQQDKDQLTNLVEEAIKQLDEKIRNMIQNVPDKYIIDLSKI